MQLIVVFFNALVCERYHMKYKYTKKNAPFATHKFNSHDDTTKDGGANQSSSLIVFIFSSFCVIDLVSAEFRALANDLEHLILCDIPRPGFSGYHTRFQEVSGYLRKYQDMTYLSTSIFKNSSLIFCSASPPPLVELYNDIRPKY